MIQTSLFKECFKCKVVRPLTEFYKHFEMKDGHLNKCKDCTKLDEHNRRWSGKRENILAYDRARYYESGYRYLLPELEYQKEYRRKHPEKMNAYRIKYPYKYIAHNKAQRIKIAVCEMCGTKNNLIRHHPDYSKPLTIQSLCSSCHGKIHRKYRVAL